jgi:hypothetical protein
LRFVELGGGDVEFLAGTFHSFETIEGVRPLAKPPAKFGSARLYTSAVWCEDQHLST